MARWFSEDRSFLKDGTSILIAHRLSSVKTADRVVVMQKGDIIEIG